MAGRSCVGWDNKPIGRPRIEGSLEISRRRADIFIGGDPDGLRSFAKLLIWLANVDQESLNAQPDGERCHVHLHTRDAEGFNSLTPFSTETELCRLDAKGTGEFPEKYRRLAKKRATGAKGAGKGVKKPKTPKRSAGKSKGCGGRDSLDSR